MVNDDPEQTEPPAADITGIGFTVTVATAGEAETQPRTVVPVTE
jgi:hypothetical protein